MKINTTTNRVSISVIGFILAVSIAPISIGSSLTVPKIFSTGETLTAADLNNNFQAGKTAVDDNDSRITNNTADISGNEARITDIENSRQSGIEGVQIHDFGVDDKSVTTTSLVELLSVLINETGIFDVSLSAHIYTEIGTGSGRYEYLICKTACTCSRSTSVGATFWRPIDSSSGFQAVTVPLTGFAINVFGPATYKVCARKFEVSAPDASMNLRGVIANWSRP